MALRSMAVRVVRSSPLLRLRPVVAAVQVGWSPAALVRGTAGVRCFSTRPTTSSLNDPSPNWSNRPPKETILLDGCDFEHWLVVVDPPEEGKTRDEIIDSYIKTLAKVVGSEEEARMKIYSVSTKHYFAFGALVSEELSYKIKELPGVRWVLPDSYLDVKNKDYGGEPFINGQAVPYDPKYHEEWVRNNARANERSRRNDRPRNFDRSRNFERRRENMQNRDFQSRSPMPNPDMHSVAPSTGPNVQGPPPHMPSAGPNVQGPPLPPPPPPPQSAPQYMNRDAGNMSNPPPYQGQPYHNQGPGYQRNYAPPMHNPEFQNRGQGQPPPSAPQSQGHMPPPYAPASISQPPNQGGSPYPNGGPPAYQGGFASNRDGSGIPGGNAYQGGGPAYPGAGAPYHGSGNQAGGGYPGGAGNSSYQVGGSAGGFQGTGGGIPQARDMPGRD